MIEFLFFFSQRKKKKKTLSRKSTLEKIISERKFEQNANPIRFPQILEFDIHNEYHNTLYIIILYIRIYLQSNFFQKKKNKNSRTIFPPDFSLSLPKKKKRINHPPSRSRKRQIHPCNICSSEPNGTDLSSNPPNSISPSSANSPKRQYHNFLQPSGADLITPPPINRKPDLIVPVIEKAKTVVKRTMSQSKIRFTQWENGEVI